MTTRKVHDRKCELCGSEFKGGKYSNVCDACKAKSRKGRAKNLMKDKEDYSIGFGRMMESYIQINKEKLPEFEICPNFNADDLSCVLCGFDEWRFRACGRKK